MKRKANHALMLWAIVVAFSGCQSGPSWAWWKHDKAPDASAVAKSGEPTLPSAQSNPQAVAIAGLTPATPPSSANLAAASAPSAAVPTGSTPLTAPSTTTNPQLPPFSPANSLADKLTSAPNVATKSAVGTLPTSNPTTPAAAQASQSLASTPPSGPYDPKGYKPPSSGNNSDLLGGAGSSADRYGMGTASDRYAPASQTNKPTQTASMPENRYGSTTTAQSAPPTPVIASASPATAPIAAQPATPAFDRYSSPTAMASAPQSPVSAQGVTGIAGSVATLPSTPMTSTPATAQQNIQLTSAPGQYRPGGTSTYVGSSAAQPIEIATRPTPPSAGNPSLPPTTPGQSVPWTPSTAPATRMY